MYPICIPVAVWDPIPLWHFRKQEILQKIDLMEDKYGEHMTFYESLILAHVAPMAAGAEVGSWRYGVAVYGAAWGHRRELVMSSLMADMYGFASEEEMQDTKAYLWSHDSYQLEQVNKCLLSKFVVLCPLVIRVSRFHV